MVITVLKYLKSARNVYKARQSDSVKHGFGFAGPARQITRVRGGVGLCRGWALKTAFGPVPARPVEYDSGSHGPQARFAMAAHH